MRFVEVEDVIDPGEYLGRLPGLQDRLPPGAWAFASDPGHYNFYSKRCVKDLTVGRISLWPEGEFQREADPEVGLEVVFEPNQWKHDQGLRISYSGVQHIEMRLSPGMPLGVNRMGQVILDEILPAEGGSFTHEIALHGSTLFIQA